MLETKGDAERFPEGSIHNHPKDCFDNISIEDKEHSVKR